MPDIPISPGSILLALGIVIIGAAVQGSLGFGLGLLAAPILLLIHPEFVPGPMLGAALILTILVAHRDRTGIDFHGLRFALIGRVIATAPAAFLVARLPATYFQIAFAALVLLAVAISVLVRAFTPTPGRAVAAGALSGFMATMCSVGGPPIALLYQHAEGSRLRGTLAGFFLVGATLSIGALAVVGRFGGRELMMTALLAPGVVIGFALSGRLARRLDGGGVRPLVLVLSVASAAVVLWRAFMIA